MAPKSSENQDPVSDPRSWRKALKAAGMRLLGATQAEAAEAAGLSERSVHKYEQCSWWAEAEKQARDEWLDDVRAAAYRKLLELVRDGDGKTIRWFLERAGGDEFLPPRQKIEQDLNADVTQEDDSESVDLSNLSDDELEELKRLRMKAETDGSTSDTSGN